MMKIVVRPNPKRPQPKLSYVRDMPAGTVFTGSGDCPSVYLKTTHGGYVDVQTGIYFAGSVGINSMFPLMDTVLTMEEILE